MEKENFKPKRIVIPVRKIFYCKDGVMTSDMEEAFRHGYGEGGCKSFSFSYDLQSVDYDVLPIAEKFQLRLVPGRYSDGDALQYLNDDSVILYHPFEKISWFIRDYGERFTGTIDHPYEYLDQGVNFKIFDYQDFTIIIQCDDVDSENAIAFKIRKLVYHEELNKIYRQIGVADSDS